MGKQCIYQCQKLFKCPKCINSTIGYIHSRCGTVKHTNEHIIIILVINVTAACVRGCTASVAYWSQEKEKKRKGVEQKRTTDSKSTQLMEIQRIIKEMCMGGELYFSELH